MSMKRPRSTINNVTYLACVDDNIPSISKNTEKLLHIYMLFAVLTFNLKSSLLFSILTLSYFFHITNHEITYNR